MLEDFLSYIESNLSVIREDKILLAVSGGVDSMVMLHLFRELAFDIEVAHVNHSTRNGQSDQDMAFVNAYCKAHSIPFHSRTLDYYELKKGNFQENARNARFEFFQNVKQSRGCKWIATAHHKDDRWETFLMNLNRKSGIKGLTSLKVRDNDIIHPLLAFSKKQIIDYAKQEKIKYTHDESNDTNAYLRNKIRHQVTPTITEIFRDFINNVNQSITHLEQANNLTKELIEQLGLVQTKDHSELITISLEKIKQFKHQSELLYTIINEYDFNYSSTLDILSTKETGALFHSASHEGLYDRGQLILRKQKSQDKIAITIKTKGSYELSNGKKINS